MIHSDVHAAFKLIFPSLLGFIVCSMIDLVISSATLAPTLRMYLPKGLRSRLECPVTSNPPLRFVVWTRNGTILDRAKVKRMDIDKHGTLTIAEVLEEDEGLYACTPYSPLDADFSSISILVFVKDLPFFSVRPLPVYQRLVGQSVVMPCVANGDPKPSIHWKKIEGQFPPKTKTLLDAGNLTIVHLTSAEQGIYECIARNVVTTIITTTLLLIQSMVEEHPHNISIKTTSSSAKVSWLPPLINESQNYRYELWYQMVHTKTNDEWQKFGAIPDNATSVTVFNLLPRTSYRFKMLSNHSGRFHFSQEIVATTDVLSGFNSRTASPVLPTKPHEQTTKFTDPVHSTHPHPPSNVVATQVRDGIHLRWQRPRNSPVPVDYYVIEYQTTADNRWIRLPETIPGSATEFRWNKVSPVSATYHFRVLSAGRSIFSDPSASVKLVMHESDSEKENYHLSGDKVAGIVVGIFFVLVAGVSALLVFRFRSQKQKKQPEAAYERSEEVSLNASTSINRALEGQASPLEESISILDNHAQDRQNNYELGHIHETPI